MPLSFFSFFHFFVNWTSHSPVVPLTSWSTYTALLPAPISFLASQVSAQSPYLFTWMTFCVKEQQIKTEKLFEIHWSMLKSCLSCEDHACDSEVDHGTRPDCSVHGSLSHLLPRTQIFQKIVDKFRLSSFLPTAPTAFLLPSLLPHWLPVPNSVSCTLLQPQPSCIHCPGHLGYPCHQEPPGSSTFPSGSHFRLCPWLLWLFLSATHHCVTLAVGVTHPLQG